MCSLRAWATWLKLAAAFLGSLARSAAAEPPARYPLDYPVASSFCVPVRTYAEDVVQSAQEINGQIIRRQPNGGYGLPIKIQVQGKNLLHLGADVAWFRIGDPVFAIADGVVRQSQGPAPRTPESAKKPRDAAARLEWGNLIVIEHRLSDETFITSVYGHLSNQRRVQPGQIVQAGNVIGYVGRQGRDNGGYDPHLHFGIRQGRAVEPGMPLFKINVPGKTIEAHLSELNEEEIEITAPGIGTGSAMLTTRVETLAVHFSDDKALVPARVLYAVGRPDFSIDGYGLTTQGWPDPTEFLRRVSAGAPPAAE